MDREEFENALAELFRIPVEEIRKDYTGLFVKIHLNYYEFKNFRNRIKDLTKSFDD